MQNSNVESTPTGEMIGEEPVVDRWMGWMIQRVEYGQCEAVAQMRDSGMALGIDRQMGH